MEAGRHVLVVEDCARTRDGLRALLQRAGYRVTGASNGWEALHHLRHGEPPFVILLDLSMPVMDGWHFLREQRQDPVLAHLPVILLSAEADLPRQAASLGVAAHFAKPVAFDHLLETMGLFAEGPAVGLAV